MSNKFLKLNQKSFCLLLLLFLVEFHQGSSHLIVNDKSRETGSQFDESDALTTEFMSYIKASL